MFFNVSYVVEIDYDSYFNNLGRIKYIGTIWDLYKPQKEKSLYAQIVKDPANIQVSNIIFKVI